MIVTEIIPINSKRCRICIDGEPAFILYKGEVRRYGLEADKEISREEYDEITGEVLLKRGKARALHLLQSMDRTEGQMRNKLREGGYPEHIIDEILEYVKGYHYVDDSRYASAYFRTKGQTKSVRQMSMELRNKGVSKELIQQTLESTPEIDERAAIRGWIEKKHIDMENIEQEQLRKFYQFLLRKGFRYEDIQSELKLYQHF